MADESKIGPALPQSDAESQKPFIMKKATCLEKLEKDKVDSTSLKKFLAGGKTAFSKAFWPNQPKKKPASDLN